MRVGLAVGLVGSVGLWVVNAAVPGQETGYQLRAGTRIVAEDVTVIDARGNPVTGLPESAFHVTDDGKVQTINGFEESARRREPGAAVATRPGDFSNRALNENQGTVTVLLVDPIGLELGDQMYLRLQMLKFLKTMPEGTQAIVFRATSRGTPVLLQSLTGDKALLTAALDRSVPTITRPVYTVYGNAIDELANMAEYLRNVPGKKALLWFAGRFPLYVQPDYGAGGGTVDTTEAQEATRAAYRAMEAARIAVYPIDVRGVVMGGIALNQASDTTAAANDPSTTTRATGGDSQQTAAAYNEMDKLAAATGGRAFYSENYVWKAMGDAIATEDHSYALSYRPTDYVEDGKWHKVKVTVDGGYQVRYRDGYYAGETARERELAARSKSAPAGYAAGGEAGVEAGNDDAAGAQPITFAARVKADAGRRNVAITYAIPTKALEFTTAADGTHRSRFRVAVVAYNADGDIKGKDLQVVETHFTDAQMSVADRIGAPAVQTVALPKGAEYLMLAVEDLGTRRVGVVQMPVKSVEGR